MNARLSTAVLLTAASALVGNAASAAVITQVTNNNEWQLAATWSNNAAPATGNDYFTSADLGVSEETLRSPFGGGRFGGDSLTIVAGSRLLTKGGNGSMFEIADLILDGGSIALGDNGVAHVLQGAITVDTASTIRMGSATRSYSIESQLGGAADLTLQGEGTMSFTNAASTYSGSFLGTSSVIADFDQSYALSSIRLDSGSQLRIDNSLTFQGVNFGGTDLAAGVYTVAALESSFGAFIADDSAGATLTVVPEPASLALLGLGGMLVLGRRRAA